MTKTTLQSFLEDAKQFKTIPIISHFFADTLTPIQIFQQLEDEAVFLLESKDEQSPWSRFSFIGLSPKYYLKESKGTFLFLNGQKELLLKNDCFKQAFQEALAYLQIKDISLPIPFRGGAVGAISYEAVELLEPILQTDASRNENSKMSFIFCETILAYDHHKKELFVIHHLTVDGIADQVQQTQLFIEAMKKIETMTKKLTQANGTYKLYEPPLDEEVTFDHVKSNYSKELFLEHIERIKAFIRSGDVFQAVISQRFEMEVNVTGIELYRVLRMINPSPYLFYLKIDDVEIIGSSPEKLVQIQNGEIEIHPIAGTRRRGHSKEEDEALAIDLLKDEKEKAEHYMLVDLARNDIGRVAKYGSVNVPVLMEVGRFSHVMHMISKVTGKLASDIHPIDVLFSSFPAGTVSGAPKIRAMQILKQLEPTERGYYAGAIGYLGFDGNIDSCIAIRTMVVKGNKAYVQAGAGIVSDSVPEKEWEETRNKAKALIKAITVAERMFAKGTEEKKYV